MRGFLVRLSDEQREKLEAIRAMRGLRSMSDAVRSLIDSEKAKSNAEIALFAHAKLNAAGQKTAERDAAEALNAGFRGTTALGEPLPDRKPYQKTGKTK